MFLLNGITTNIRSWFSPCLWQSNSKTRFKIVNTQKYFPKLLYSFCPSLIQFHLFPFLLSSLPFCLLGTRKIYPDVLGIKNNHSLKPVADRFLIGCHLILAYWYMVLHILYNQDFPCILCIVLFKQHKLIETISCSSDPEIIILYSCVSLHHSEVESNLYHVQRSCIPFVFRK